MTITQLKYIIAVTDCNNFAKAAEKCHVTQSTLSTQIKKLEENLNTVLFDRKKKPVQPTDIGLQIINQSRVALSEINHIRNIINTKKEDCSGELRIGIIPTLSPYLLPLFTIPFLKENSNIQLIIKEMLSEDIVYNLHNNKLDVGILVTPMDISGLQHIPLFYEPFVLYTARNNNLAEKTQIRVSDLDINDMWFLKEGHCFRNQMFNICSEHGVNKNKNRIHFESGSLESLRRMVEQQYGYTLLPKLATLDFTPEQELLTKDFLDPKPAREVSIITNRKFMKRKVVESLKRNIIENIPKELRHQKKKKVIAWE